MSGKTDAEGIFAFHVETAGLPEPQRQYRFHKPRRWAFDFAWPELMLAVEIEGILYGKDMGRHQRGTGYEKDLEKYLTAQLDGWSVMRFSPKMVKGGKAIAALEEFLTTLLVH